MTTQNPQLVILPTIHLKKKNTTELDQVPVTLIIPSNDPIQLTKYAPVGSLQLFTDYHENQSIADQKIKIVAEKEGEILPCIPHEKVNFDSTSLGFETQSVRWIVRRIWGNLILTLRWHWSTKLLIMDNDSGNHLSIIQKYYPLPLKHTQWVQDELEMSKNNGVVSWCVSPWSGPLVTLPKKAKPEHIHQKWLCVDYHILNSLLPPMVMTHSRAQGVLSLVAIPKIDYLYTMVNGSSVYSLLDCTSGYHHIALSPEAQKKSAFITPIGKYEFKKVLFGSVQDPTYFQKIINEVIKGLPFAFGCLDDIFIFSQNTGKHFEYLGPVFDRLRMEDLKVSKEMWFLQM